MAKKSIIPLEQFQKIINDIELDKKQYVFTNAVVDIIVEEANRVNFKKLRVYTLGSLSYGGLCLYSDVDLLVVGPRDLTEEFSLALEKKLANIRIKWWPELDFNLVEDIFEHISLFFCKSLDSKHESEFKIFKQDQFKYVLKGYKTYKADLEADRLNRSQRYGSESGGLTPNIKFGPGGLRDTCQAIAWLSWSIDSIGHHKSESLINKFMVHLLNELQIGFINIYQFRFFLSLSHNTEQLSLELWDDLIKILKWTEVDRQGFYQMLLEQSKNINLTFDFFNPKQLVSDFVIDRMTTLNQIINSEDILLKKIVRILNFIDKSEKSCLSIYAYDIFSFLKQVRFGDAERSMIFDWIHNLFLRTNERHEIDFLFDSGFMPSLLQEWVDINGLIQSDHYHKYTVSEHLKMTLLSVCELQANKSKRLSIDSSCEDVTLQDWQNLKWVSLFHDLKKGQREDHSVLGYKAVHKFSFFNQDQKNIIGLLVENHLELSKFAFRYEHSDVQYLKKLNDKFEIAHNIKLLLVFTAADIMGSNLTAWNMWKSDQLRLAYRSLMDFRNNKIQNDLDYIGGFDLSPYLVKVIGRDYLINDIEGLKIITDEDWSVEEFNHCLWVRVYKSDEGPGTLSHILNILFLAGLPVEQAFIATGVEGKMVYNWFRLPMSFSKNKKQITARLKILIQKNEFGKKDLFAKIDNVIFLTENNNKFSFVFKGIDQSGTLLFISKIFESMNIDILKAQINTWGSRIEDLFIVKKGDATPESVLSDLKNHLKLSQSIKI